MKFYTSHPSLNRSYTYSSILLKRSITFLESLQEPEAYLARVYFKLAQIYAATRDAQDDERQAKELAMSYLQKCKTDLLSADEKNYSEEVFDLAVPFMLW